MDASDRLPGLLHQLYAAPGTIEGWHTFLDQLRGTVDGSGANLICHDVRSLKGTVVAFVGTVASASFARHSVLVRLIGGAIEKEPAGAAVISVSRSERHKPFGRDEAVLFDALVPHLQRALQFHRRLSSVEAVVDDFAGILDKTSRAVFLVDSAGRITFANHAASRLASARDGLTIERGELRPAGPADRTRLSALLAGAVSTSNAEGLGAGGALAVGRPSGRRPYQLLVCPVSRPRTTFLEVPAAAAAVFVTDPEQVAGPDEHTLRTLFALTPAEARLTFLLVRGSSLDEAAAELGVRRETARSRLKTIFEKTNTHRQAELVRLVVDADPHV